MATAKPGDASSSPSGRAIVGIDEQGAARGIARIDLSDGSSFFALAPAVSTLMVGGTLPDDEVERLHADAECALAREAALRILAIREHSRSQLAAKLTKRSFSAAAIRRALDTLESNGSLDDRRFAELWVASRLRRNPQGRARLSFGLRAAGLDRDLVDDALGGLTEEQEREALVRAAARLTRSRVRSDDEMSAALSRKGFSYSQIRNWLREKNP